MKTILSIAAVLNFVLFFGTSLAQNSRIVVQRGDSALVFTQLTDAIANSENGDYVYLPGGTFGGDISITKRLHIIGTGHYLNATTATGRTELTGEVSVFSEADSGSISGVYSTKKFYFKHNSNMNYTVSRSYFGGVHFQNPNSTSTILIHGCVFSDPTNGADISGYTNAQNVVFSNNIVDGRISGFGSGSIFSNNVFLSNGILFMNSMHSVSFENNVINGPTSDFFGTGGSSSSNLVFNSNIFANQPDINAHGNVNNQFSIALGDVFTSIWGNRFNYNHNYRLKEGSPAIGAGNGGVDIGIYGGDFPYKENAIPRNPRIISRFISAGTDGDGTLQINITVEAQND